MKRFFTKVSITINMVLLSITSFAQEKQEITGEDYTNQSVEMADQFRADGKIYVVVVIIMLVVLGLFFYLFRTDQRLKVLEKEVLDKES